jgi:hypothetical protein
MVLPYCKGSFYILGVYSCVNLFCYFEVKGFYILSTKVHYKGGGCW